MGEFQPGAMSTIGVQHVRQALQAFGTPWAGLKGNKMTGGLHLYSMQLLNVMLL